MEIGEPKRIVTVEPLEIPVGLPRPEPEPDWEPVTVPSEPEPVSVP